MPKTEKTLEPAAAEKRTAEAWAEAKGMLPQFIAAPAPFARPGAARALVPNPNYDRFAAAKVAWPIGFELTEAEFDAAVDKAMGHIHR